MKLFFSFVLKEMRHIFRDRRTMLILFGMPSVMMLLFGFAISTEVRNVRFVAVMPSQDMVTRRIVNRLDASETFVLCTTVGDPAVAIDKIRSGEADMGIVFTPRFADDLPSGHSKVQLLLDGTDPNTTTQQSVYAQQIIAATLRELAGVKESRSAEVVTRLLYNPQMKSAYNFVPGIMGMILLLVCAMMTSVSIVREKERGTMEVLLVSPVRPLLMMLAKAVPYFLLSILILVLILALSHFVLDVPLAAGVGSVLLLSLLYIFLALSLGLLISVVADRQLTALLISGMLMLLPSLLLSGMIYPVENMPLPLRWLSAAIPARWFISAARKLMIMNVSLFEAGHELLILSGMTLAILGTALLKFKNRL